MNNARNGFLSVRLSLITIVGIFCSIVIFIILNIISNGSNVLKYALMSLFAGLLIITSSASVILYTLYKGTNKAMTKLKEQSSMDRLTELYNRSYLEPFLEGELDTAKRENQQVSVMMVDMDHFKEINDTYGHVVGDSVLAIFAQVVLKCLRKTDIIARYGGDEFIVVLPNTDTETASSVADRIRNEVSETYIPPIDNVVISSIHCSIGISNYPVLCDSKNTLIKTSDLALYMAKRSGRNCTKVYESEPTLSYAES
jgi:diguanylate cyclase (GGDEF)-like protein